MANSSGLANVGAPAVPNGDLSRSAFDQWVRNTLISLQSAMVPPEGVTNVRATGLAGSIQIDFTRSDGDGYRLYKNTLPDTNSAVVIDLGTANVYVDNIGDASVKRYYAVQSRKGAIEGAISAWVNATTLALGTTAAPVTPPPATATPLTNQETGAVAVQYPDKGGFVPA